MTSPIIELKNVSKKFRNRTVIHGLNLELNANQIYGFSGPNGAGKTLTFKLILGFVKATRGQVIVNGKVLRQDTLFAPGIDFAIQEYGLLADKSGSENLKLLSILSKIQTSVVPGILSYVGLDPIDDRQVREYSLGMKQRLLIAAALLRDDNILIFDEPTNALDENGQHFLVSLIRDLKSQGKTILISSHDAEFLKLVSDKIFKYSSEGNIIGEIVP